MLAPPNRLLRTSWLSPMTMATASVSPSARPSARITPPMMPARAYGRMAREMTSHLVAPSAYIASRCSCGTRRITSRATDAVYGRIMTVRMMIASASPRPSKVLGTKKHCRVVEPLSQRFLQEVYSASRAGSWKKPCSQRLRIGAITNSAHRPYTTLGTAASSSIRYPTGLASHFGAYSATNRALAMASGTLMASATRLVTRVPVIMATAPNTPSTGFQVRCVKNSSPKRCRAGQDSLPSR